MGRLRVLSGRETRKIFEEHGFDFARQRGSHMIMLRRVGESSITVPIPDHKKLRIGTLKSIIARSRLPRELFEE